MVYGTITAYNVPKPGVPGSHFGGPLQVIPFTDTKGYIALTAFVINVIVAVVLTLVLRGMRVDEGVDQTKPSDYVADAGDPGVEEVLEGAPGTAPTSA
jgi:SSS family solute:Na+ symporter